MTDTLVAELKTLVNQALNETEEKLRQYPRYGPYIHAKSQLSFIMKKIQQSEVIKSKDKKEIDIGIMAVKELDAQDVEYAQLLMEIATLFKQIKQ